MHVADFAPHEAVREAKKIFGRIAGGFVDVTSDSIRAREHIDVRVRAFCPSQFGRSAGASVPSGG